TGAGLVAVANFPPFDLGTNTLRLEPPQTTYDLQDPDDQQNVPNTLEAAIEGNDFSENPNGVATGLQCTLYPPFYYTTVDATQPITGTLKVTVRDNRFNRNGGYGICINAGFPNRNNSREHTGTVEATFEHNTLFANGRSTALFDFTAIGVTLGFFAPQTY